MTETRPGEANPPRIAADIAADTGADIAAEIQSRRWFYRFVLPSGATTQSALPPEVEPIHDTRLRMALSVLEPLVGNRWHEIEALDVPCHQGWFAMQLAARGCRRVLGTDIRPEHIADASLMARALGLQNVAFRTADITRVDPAELGVFDVVLLFGLMYHLEDPVGALRRVRAMTRGVCLIETQVAPELGGSLDWGRAGALKNFPGIFAIVDESAEQAAGNPESGVGAVSLVPSLNGLLHILRAVGFSRAEVVPPPADAYEQLACGHRVVVAAYAPP